MDMEQKGKLILVMGPSGSGKGSLLVHVRKQFPNIVFPTTWTTRQPREGEIDSAPNASSGKSYHFVSEEEFHRALDLGAFVEQAHYGGHWYGTPKQAVTDVLLQGGVVLQELEIQGVRQLKSQFQDVATVIYVDAGSWEELKKRILARGPMSEADLCKRKLRYEEEIQSKPEAEFVIENREGALSEAQRDIAKCIADILSR